MYKLIIVDDEAAIRRGMKSYVPWNDMGFEVVADFEDGKETIDYIEEHDVDVIITDIEMAEVSGLMLSKYIYENKSDIKVVILSGYKLFEYAKKALEYKVEHYLLKPLKMDEVKEVFGRLKEELDIREQATDLNGDIKLLREQFFLNLLVGKNKNIEDVLQYGETLGLRLHKDSMIALLDVKVNGKKYLSYGDEVRGERDIRNESTSIETPMCLEQEQKLLEDMFGMNQISNKKTNHDGQEAVSGERHGIKLDYYMVSFVKDLMKVIVIGDSGSFETSEMFRDRLTMDIEEKCCATRSLFQVDVQVKLEKLFSDVKSFLMFQYWLELGMTRSKEEIVKVKEEQNSEQIKKIQGEYKRILKAIHDAEFMKLKELAEKVFFEMRSVSLITLKQMVIDMFSALSTKLIRMDNNLWKHMLLTIDYQKFVDCQSREELKELCCRHLDDIMSNIESSQNDTSRQVIREAMKFIRENYDTDISLDTVADKYYLNSAYLSRLFKQYAGETFTDYLIGVRMKEAIRYIETGNYKIYEISKIVGYNSEKYFYRVFKQYTGYSPAEYQRSKVLAHD